MCTNREACIKFHRHSFKMRDYIATDRRTWLVGLLLTVIYVFLVGINSRLAMSVCPYKRTGLSNHMKTGGNTKVGMKVFLSVCLIQILDVTPISIMILIKNIFMRSYENPWPSFVLVYLFILRPRSSRSWAILHIIYLLCSIFARLTYATINFIRKCL